MFKKKNVFLTPKYHSLLHLCISQIKIKAINTANYGEAFTLYFECKYIHIDERKYLQKMSIFLILTDIFVIQIKVELQHNELKISYILYESLGISNVYIWIN